jgi:acyl carrier protein
MNDNTAERVRVLVAGVLQLPAEQINESSAAENFEAWDSVNHLNIMLALEQEFGVQLSPEQADKMTNIAAIVDELGLALRRSPYGRE